MLGLPAGTFKISSTIGQAVGRRRGVVLLHATGSKLPAVTDQVLEALSYGMHVVSTCEELAFPWFNHAALAEKIDAAAQRAGTTVLGTGINPGFVMDRLVVHPRAGLRHRAPRQGVAASSTRAPAAPALQRKVGAGLTEDEFFALVDKDAVGHVGLVESTALCALGLGLDCDDYEEELDPVFAEEDITGGAFPVKKGRVAGIHQVAVGLAEGQERVRLELTIAVGADEPGDSIELDADPPVRVSIPGGLSGDRATANLDRQRRAAGVRRPARPAHRPGVARSPLIFRRSKEAYQPMLDRNAVGRTTPPTLCEVEKGAIRRFAESLGDYNPSYFDAEYARASGFPGDRGAPFVSAGLHRERRPARAARGARKAPAARRVVRRLRAPDRRGRSPAAHQPGGRGGRAPQPRRPRRGGGDRRRRPRRERPPRLEGAPHLGRARHEGDLMPPRKLYFENIRIGDELPAMAKTPIDRVQLARYAGATGDFNAVHVDEMAARAAGMPSVVAPNTIGMGFLGQLVGDWARGAHVKRLSCRFSRMLWPGDTLVCKGRVADRHGQDGKYFLELDVWAENQTGGLVIRGNVTLKVFYSVEDENRFRTRPAAADRQRAARVDPRRPDASAAPPRRAEGRKQAQPQGRPRRRSPRREASKPSPHQAPANEPRSRRRKAVARKAEARESKAEVERK